ncbi:MAG: sulfur carrier protein ThiS [Candidatus Gastranaerophilales bacterium]|nr:sulfur carrier protein ThiS [Candidatus Gastranaerophilales bacterium]
MIIIFNGENKEVKENISISQMMKNIDTPKLYVVKLNGELIVQEAYDTTILTNGDSIELVVFAKN